MSQDNGKLTSEQVEALLREELPALKTNPISQARIKLREWSDLEDATGQNVNPWIGHNFPPIWFMQGVLWLWLRRKHPALTFEALGEIDTELLFDASNQGTEEAQDPTVPDAEPPRPPTLPASATSGT